MDSTSDGVEIREVAAALRRGWYWIVGGGALGLLAGFLVISSVAPQYEAGTLVLIRSPTASPTGALAQLSGLIGGATGGSGSSTLDTELAILQSRAVVGAVVDSLGLQVEVVHPASSSAAALFSRVAVDARARTGEYRFERAGAAYRVSGPGVETTVAPGAEVRLPDAALALRDRGLPEEFTVAIRNREKAIEAVTGAVNVGAETGDAVDLRFRAREPQVAASVLNLMVTEYLARRRTSDRGVNQNRYEFLSAHVDTIRSQLAAAEGALRVHQEQSGVLDPALAGETELTRAMEVKAAYEDADVEARAIQQILGGSRDRSVAAREVAAYPGLLSNGAVVDLFSRIMELETERSALLGTKTEQDPEVQAYGETIRHLEDQLLQLGRDYLAGLNRQRQILGTELTGYRSTLAALPSDVEQSLRREREVLRLSETLIAVQSQLVQARLDAMSEGGDVRQIDAAVPPVDPAFPSPPLTLGGGLLGGLFFGVVAAVVLGRRGRRVHEPWEVELATGLPATMLSPHLPLTFPDRAGSRTLLVIPLGSAPVSLRVAEEIARTDALQGKNPLLAELGGTPSRVSAPVAVPAGSLAEGTALAERGDGLTVVRDGVARYPASPNASQASARVVLETLEERFGTIVAVVPGLESRDTVSVLDGTRPAVLVIRAGELSGEALEARAKPCRQLDVRILGVVVVPIRRANARSA